MAKLELNLNRLDRKLELGLHTLTSGRSYEPALEYLGEKCRSYAAQMTHVEDSGEMRRSWDFRVDPEECSVSVFNTSRYAVQINQGYRPAAECGVPGAEGQAGKQFVPGQFMLQKALKTTEDHDMLTALRMTRIGMGRGDEKWMIATSVIRSARGKRACRCGVFRKRGGGGPGGASPCLRLPYAPNPAGRRRGETA